MYSRLRTPKTNNTDLAIESNTTQVKVGEKLRKNSSLSKFNETTGPKRIRSAMANLLNAELPSDDEDDLDFDEIAEAKLIGEHDDEGGGY